MPPARPSSPQESTWTQRYGQRHQLVRIRDFPAGIAAPKKVRIYRRQRHFVLQWWDSGVKRNVSDRVDGDLVAAIARAREVEARLDHFRSCAPGRRRIPHREVVRKFIADLGRRADAGEIHPRTVTRYESALGHFLEFAEQPQTAAAFASATRVNRDFALQFTAWLGNLSVTRNGRRNARKRKMGSTRYVEDVVRAMFVWAADPDRGALMPDGYRNPFSGRGRRSSGPTRDLFGEPDITIAHAAEFLSTCDAFQLPVFSLLAFYGLRPSEPCYVFREHMDADWLKVVCLPELAYLTKGRRDKRLPLIAPLAPLLETGAQTIAKGLLFSRRRAIEGRERPPLLGASLDQLAQEFEDRCSREKTLSAALRVRVRDSVLRDAGALDYDHVEHEFRNIARRLGWPQAATLKDFRHLFASAMENAGMPIFYRKYLMGQAPGREAIVAYTHLDELKQRYEEAVQRVLQPLVEAVERRAQELLPPAPAAPEGMNQGRPAQH
jgi:integrase